MLHSKEFFIWSLLPITLYLIEIYCKRNRIISKPMTITGIDMISSFILIKFKPVLKNCDFIFEEGSYVYVNCPSISKTEWYSFLISSIIQDFISSRTRIELISSEPVVPALKPPKLTDNDKWNKYIKVSQDLNILNTIESTSSIYPDKHETGYNEFLSILINTKDNTNNSEGIWITKLKKKILIVFQLIKMIIQK